MHTMKAVLLKNFGEADQLYIGETRRPEPANDELLVKVHATALNRADVMHRKGLYPPPEGASPVLGLEMAGVVEKTGPDCADWKAGDRVFGLLPGGGYAEYAAIHHRMAMPVPERFSFEEAAAVPEVFLTAYQALFLLGQLQAGQFVLIHAGGSGVGTAAIQLADSKGAFPLVTAGEKHKLDTCLKLGAVAAINYKTGPFGPAVMETTGGKGVSLVVDFIGAPYWQQNVEVLSMDGRLVFLSMMGGSIPEKMDLRIFMKKRLQVMGSTLRNRSRAYKIELTRAFSEFALPAFRSGRIKPVIDQIFPWEAVAEAHRRMEQNKKYRQNNPPPAGLNTAAPGLKFPA